MRVDYLLLQYTREAMRQMISIIVCTVDRRDSLEATLSSISGQTCRDYEVILVNQGDLNDVDSWEGTLGNFKVISLRQRGLSIARNIGIQEARGEILGFVDDDCILGEDWIKESIRTFERDAELAAVCGRILAPDGRKPYLRLHSSDEKQITYGNVETFSGGCILFRRKTFEKIGVFDEELGVGQYLGSAEDTDICYRMLSRGMKVLYNPRIVCYHPSLASVGWENLAKKLYSYNLGTGAVHAKHTLLTKGWKRILVIFNFLVLLLKPPLRIAQYVFLLQIPRSKGYCQVLNGRIAGFFYYLCRQVW